MKERGAVTYLLAIHPSSQKYLSPWKVVLNENSFNDCFMLLRSNIKSCPLSVDDRRSSPGLYPKSSIPFVGTTEYCRAISIWKHYISALVKSEWWRHWSFIWNSLFAYLIQKNFNGSNTDSSFTTATSKTTAAGIIVFRIISSVFLFYVDNGMLCVLIRIASVRRF